MVQQMGGLSKLKNQQAAGGRRPGAGGMPQLPPGISREQIAAMQSMVTPEMRQQMRQAGGPQAMMKQLMGGGGGPGGFDMSSMMNMMRGGGGGGLADMMKGMMGGSGR